jgi:hypothetical protein
MFAYRIRECFWGRNHLDSNSIIVEDTEGATVGFDESWPVWALPMTKHSVGM